MAGPRDDTLLGGALAPAAQAGLRWAAPVADAGAEAAGAEAEAAAGVLAGGSEDDPQAATTRAAATATGQDRRYGRTGASLAPGSSSGRHSRPPGRPPRARGRAAAGPPVVQFVRALTIHIDYFVEVWTRP